MATTAKAWGKAPSDYLPELGTWERFVVDEACAYVYALEQDRRLKEQPRGVPKPLADQDAMSWMTGSGFATNH